MHKFGLFLVALAGIVVTASQAVADTFTAPYVQSSPTIDGTLGAGEWSGASSYTVSMVRKDGTASNNSTLYFQHDGTNLYIGVDSGWGAGWDVYRYFAIDGNDDKQLDGSLTSPHIDIDIGHTSPGGWGGYTAYWALPNVDSLVGTTHYPVLFPGEASASAGSSDVTYEFCIPLADLDVTPGQSVGFLTGNGEDGIAAHERFIAGAVAAQPSTWETLNLAPTPTPEPSTLALLASGAVGLAAYGWRRWRKRATQSTESPAILSFPSCSAEVERRAAA